MEPKTRTAYWVFPQEGDALPFSGLHRIYVTSVGPKWVRFISPYDGIGHRIPRKIWDRDVPNVEDHGQPLAAVLNSLRPFTSRNL